MAELGLAINIIQAFKDVYLTAKFIKRTAHSCSHFDEEQSRMRLQFDVQVIRLKNFSRIFSSADGKEVDVRLLANVPKDYLQTVEEVLANLAIILCEYRVLASTLDDDYMTYSPRSVHFEGTFGESTIYIDDDTVPKGTDAAGSGQSQGKPEPATEEKAKRWSLFGFSLRSARKGKNSVKEAAFSRLPAGVQWLFKKEKFAETLERFKEWNQYLEWCVIPSILVGFGFLSDRGLQARLQGDGNVDMFKPHLKLNELARADSSNAIKESDACDPIPWVEAESKIGKPRVLVEYKKPSESNSEEADTTFTESAVRELYAPQLARLLRTAGQHHFHTLPFSGYAWDTSKSQYAFLFDYPAGAAAIAPLSLNDFIVSKDPRFKLQLKHRFAIASVLAQAIGAFHSDGWLHKSIRSHAVKFFFLADGETCDLPNPYLTDFEFSRPEAGVTRLLPAEPDVDHDVYRHPDRYGQTKAAGFNKIHDIYSLGVVLLEIGLWQTARKTHQDIVKHIMRGKIPDGGVPALTMKNEFLEDARGRLAHRMGQAYQEAVISCLDGGLNEFVGTVHFATEFQRLVVKKVDAKANIF